MQLQDANGVIIKKAILNFKPLRKGNRAQWLQISEHQLMPAITK